jgi:hypothetical protein
MLASIEGVAVHDRKVAAAEGAVPDHTLAFVMSAINRAFARSMVLHCPHLREL